MNAPLNASDARQVLGSDGGKPAEGSTQPVSGVQTVDVFPCPFCGRLPEIENLGGFLCALHDESECPLTVRGWSLCVWNNRATTDGQQHSVSVPARQYYRLPHRDEHGHCDDQELRPDREDYR